MKKYGWMAAGLLLTVVGCQRREMLYLGEDVAPIHFSVAYQDAAVAAESAYSSQAPQTKALVDLPKGVTVRVLAFQRSSNNNGAADPRYDVFKAQCTYVADGNGGLTPCAVKADGSVDNGAGATVPEAISLNNGTYDFYAYSPALPLDNGSNYAVSGITHGMDWLGAVVTAKSVSKAAATVKLEFEHKCAKLTFNVKQPDGADVSKLTVDSVVVHQMNPVSNVSGWWIHKDLTSGVGNANDSCVFDTFGPLNDNSDPAKPKLIGRTGFGCVLPKQPGTVPAEIYLTLGDSNYLFKTELPVVTYEKGKNYTYNLNFKQTVVEFKLDVLAWDDVKIDYSGGVGDDNLGGVLVGSWYYFASSGTMGEDNVAGDVGDWKPVSPNWSLGNGTGSANPGGNVNNWGNTNNPEIKPGDPGNNGSTNPSGPGNWGNVNDNQPGLGQ